MTGWRKRTIVEMAREAGADTLMYWDTEKLKRFAALVREDEREACAKKAETLGVHPALNVFAGGPDWYKHGQEIAAAIRARKEQA